MAGGGSEVSLPGVVFLEAELSFRNCSRKDIWEEGRSPSTRKEQIALTHDFQQLIFRLVYKKSNIKRCRV
jgi:hypothetical protein